MAKSSDYHLPPSLVGLGGEPGAHLPPVASKAQRNRDWEKRTNSTVATYRGIPPELQAAVKVVADELGVPVGDVARMLLERGLEAFKAGELKPQVLLTRGKSRIYPDS